MGWVQDKSRLPNCGRCQKKIQSHFHEVKNDAHVPSVMRLRKINNTNRPSKLLSVDTFYHNDYSYVDEISGVKRYNTIEYGLHKLRHRMDNNVDNNHLLMRLKEHVEDRINSENVQTINFIEGRTIGIDQEYILAADDHSAIQMAQYLSSTFKMPVTYHTGQTDIIPRHSAINSHLSELRRGNPNSAIGMRTIRAKDTVKVNGEFTSRSYLVGSEYSRPLLDFIERFPIE